jgi:universal stress protein A
MTAFEHVLVPVDLSEHTGPAIAQGAALANACRARLTVLYVASTLIEPEVRDRLMARLDEAVEAHPAACLRAEVEMLAGDPAREILTFARDRSVDLIVLGMRRHDVIERLFVPSVGEAVARNASCPVLAVTRGPKKRPRAGATSRRWPPTDASPPSSRTPPCRGLPPGPSSPSDGSPIRSSAPDPPRAPTSW